MRWTRFGKGKRRNEEKQGRQRLADAEKGRLCVEQKRLEMEQEEIKRRKEKEKASNSQMKLQKFDHPTFDGSILKWREFWDAFEAAVHKNKDMSEVDKLNFLKNKMTGKAEILVRGYALTRENYPLVIKLLEERFGGKQACVAAHHQELMNIPASTNNTTKLRTTFDHMESHLRSLEALGESQEQPIFVSMIQNKLPSDVLLQLEMLKETTTEWTVTSLRKAFQRHLMAREAAERSKPEPVNEKPKNTPQGPPSRTPTPGYQYQKKSTTEDLVAAGGARKFNCVYCEGGHWSDECHKFKDATTRREKLKEQHRCFLCLAKHDRNSCRSERKCFHCGKTKSHHSSLCLTKFGSKKEEQSDRRNGAQSGASHVNMNPAVCTISGGDTVLLQTAVANASNVGHLEQTTKIRILLDSGSIRTFMSEEMARKMKLEPVG